MIGRRPPRIRMSARFARWALAGVTVFAGGAIAVAAGDRVVPVPWGVRIDPVRADHPRLFVSAKSLDRARQRFLSGDPRWERRVARLRAGIEDASGHRLATSERLPDGGRHDNASLYVRMRADGHALVDLGLGWRLTGEREYARQGIALLRALSRLDLRDSISGPGAGMVVARGYVPIATGYDLLADHPEWSEADEAAFRAWSRRLVEMIVESRALWRRNHYFNRQYYQNHEVAMTLGLLTAGIVLRDRELAQFALDHPENHRDLIDLISGAILMPGDETHHREPEGWELHPGEIYDRYRHHTAKAPVPHEGGKGLQYAHLSLSLLTMAAELLHNNGIDLYAYSAPGGESLERAHAFYCDFYARRDSSLKGGLYAGETGRLGKVGDSPALFEIAARRYPDNPHLAECVRLIRDQDCERERLIGHLALLWGVD